MAYVPPSVANGLRGEGRRIIVGPDIHPARVGGKIINSTGRGAAKFPDQKVMHTRFLGIALGTPLPAGALENAHELLLYRVDGNYESIFGQGRLDRLVDEA
jgi:hypothetical protein